MPVFKNQYLLTRHSPAHSPPKSFVEHESVAGYAVHASKYLSVTVQHAEATTVAILGDVFDPQHPTATNADIAARLCRQETPQTALAALQRYSGRFVAIITAADNTVVIPDAGCLRRVLFTDDTSVITSSLKLFLDAFDLDRQGDPAAERFATSDQFWENGATWPGNQTLDRRLTRLLPNHYIDLESSCQETENSGATRRPLRRPPVSTRSEVIDLIGETLVGTLAAVAERYSDMRFALTAGMDSRLLLAAAEGVEDRASFYTNINRADDDLAAPERTIPLALAKALNLNYRIVQPRELTDEFKSALRENYCNPRFTENIRSVQHRYYNGDWSATIDVRGHVTEIIRAFYSTPLSEASPDLLADLYGYREDDFVRGEFAKWLQEAEPYAEQTGINIFDLFYWEQRVGNWVSRSAYERDIAGRTAFPFNNYDFLLAGLSVPRSERKGPDYPFFRELIETLRPELLEYPINPTTKSRQQRVRQGLKQAADEDPRLYRAKRFYRSLRAD